MGLFYFVPVLGALWMSFQDSRADLYAPQWVGLANYARLMTHPEFQHTLQTTVVFVAGVVPAMVSLPIAMALLVNGQAPGLSVVRVLLYLPVVVSMVVAGITWKWLLADEGLMNAGLQALGLPSVPWLLDPTWALLSVMIVVVWKGLAYYMMMYLAQLQSVNTDLYEAASLDGASLLRQHWVVTLPHLRPVMLLVGLISTIGGLKVFTEIYVLTRGGPLKATETLVYFIYQKAFEQLDLGLATAAGVVFALILLGLSIAQVKLFHGDAVDQA